MAAPECANNATTGGDMVPMLTLGVPGDVVTRGYARGLMLIGVRPGPLLFTEQPVLIYTLLAGFIVMQVVCFILGMLSIKASVRILSIPNTILMPTVVVLCMVGVFTISTSSTTCSWPSFGLLGYFMKKFNYPGRRSSWASSWGRSRRTTSTARSSYPNDWSIMLRRPISAVLLVLAVISIAAPIYTAYREKNKKAAAA